MKQIPRYSLPSAESISFLSLTKTRLSTAAILLGGVALASVDVQAATIGFIPSDPTRTDPVAMPVQTISSPDSAIVNIGVRLTSGDQNWQSSCTVKGKLVLVARSGTENANYRLLSSTSFSLTTIPNLDGSGDFETVDQDILFEAIQAPLTEGDVSVGLAIRDLEATCGDTDVRADIGRPNFYYYGGRVTIEEGFNQPTQASEEENPTLMISKLGSDLRINTKI